MILNKNKTIKPTVFFINDKKNINNLYRKSLMEHIRKKQFDVRSVGLKRVLHLWFLHSKSDFIYSSNLRTNLIICLLFFNNVNIILNGLGRYHRNKIFRFIVGKLLGLGNKRVFIQNYRDYRYFRRNFAINKTEWVIGSGASYRRKNGSDGYFNINRDNKIELCIDELKDFCNKYKVKIKIVGIEKNLKNLSIQKVGIVDQSEILLHGKEFVWLGGYGDGFPHSLADVLFNQITVHISKKEFIRFGLYKLSKTVIKRSGWYVITPQNFDELSCENVNDLYTTGLH